MIRRTVSLNSNFLVVIIAAASSMLAGVVIVFADQKVQIVAAGITLLFLIAALRASKVSKRRIAIGLWVLLISHRAFILRVEAASMNMEALQNNFLEVAITVFLFLSAVFILITSLNEMKRLNTLGITFWLLVYAAFASISLIWTPNPLYAVFWLMRLFSTVVLVAIGLTGADERACQAFATATLIGMLPYVALPIIALYFGAVNPDFRAISYWLHPVSAGIISFSVAMAFLVRIFQNRKARGIHYILVGVSLISAFVAAGKSGAVGAALVLVVLFMVQKEIWIKTTIFLMTLLIVIVVIIRQLNIEVGLIAHWSYYWEQYRFGTLYARFDLWKGAVQMWLQSLKSALVGYGFAATNTTGINAASGVFISSHAHNSFLQVLVEMGPLGLVPFVVIIAKIMLQVVRHRKTLYHSPVLPLLAGHVVLVTSSLGNTVFGGSLTPQFYLFIGLSATIEQMLISNGLSKSWPSTSYLA